MFDLKILMFNFLLMARPISSNQDKTGTRLYFKNKGKTETRRDSDLLNKAGEDRDKIRLRFSHKTETRPRVSDSSVSKSG